MDLATIQQDGLVELLNIGFGRAASSLSGLTRHRVLLDMPQVTIQPVEAVAESLARVILQDVASVHQIFSGDVSGDALLLLDQHDAGMLKELLTGEPALPLSIDASTREVITEVGNILLNACLGTFGNLLHVQVAFSVPHLDLQSLGAILESLRVNRERVRYALVVHAGFKLRDAEVRAYLVIVLSVASLDRLIREVESWGKAAAVMDCAALRTVAMARWFEDLADRGIIATDQELIVRAWNPWLVDHTGIPESDAIGRSLFAICPSIMSRGLDQFYRDALAGEIRVLSQRLHRFLIPVVRNAAPAASDAAQTARIAPLTDGARIVGTITIVEDVSERVAGERELRGQILLAERARAIAEDASKLKDEFLATLSHEIRTPLNAVLGWARILRTQQHVTPPDRGLEVIERNAASQLRLVEDLLDMARVVSGKLRLEMALLVVQDVVQAAIDVVTPAANAKAIVIHTSFDPSRPRVNGDADRLQQAMWNLLSNAVKFTPCGGRVEVQVAREHATVVITVADNGQGIAPEFLPYVFDRFRQADASPSRRNGGLGLGLALVRHLVELHGGRVTVQSAGTDTGASFSVRLPVAEIVRPAMTA